MTKQVHTILCWLLALSLVWLPFSVSADTPLSITGKATCHEVNPVMSVQATVIDSSMYESMIQKSCCCDSDCVACANIASCQHSSNHVSAFILFNQHSPESHPRIQFSIERSIQYHSHTITPDIRPPIV